jgi:outer membrane protein TolC
MKIYKRIFLLLILFVGFSAYGQENINTILNAIDENNPTIAALRAHFDYVKADARAELLPPNPSIEGGRFPAVQGAGIKYAWGVSQSFEFPTVYAKRGQLAKTTDKFTDVSFIAARQEVLLTAKFSLLECIHTKRLIAEYSHREAFAQNMLTIIQKKLDAGEATAMDLNYAKLRVVEMNQQRKSTEDQSSILMRRISALNGNIPVTIDDTTLILSDLPPKNVLVATYFVNDSRLIALDYMNELAEQNIQLVRQQGFPELSIGFQSEQTDAEHFRGFMAGISIPLWGNTGKSRAAKISKIATQAEKQSQVEMLKLEYDEIYLKAISVKSQHYELKKALEDQSNVSLLRKALEAGEVSIIELFNEITFLYDLTDKVLELELEYAKLYAELHRFEL